MPQMFYPWERPSTQSTGGWVGPVASLDRQGKPRLHRYSIPTVQPTAGRYTNYTLAAAQGTCTNKI